MVILNERMNLHKYEDARNICLGSASSWYQWRYVPEKTFGELDKLINYYLKAGTLLMVFNYIRMVWIIKNNNWWMGNSSREYGGWNLETINMHVGGMKVLNEGFIKFISFFFWVHVTQ